MTRDPNAALRLLLFGTEDRPVNMSRLAAKMHRHRTTLYKWKDKPSMMSVGDLRRMVRILGLDWEEVGRALGGRK